MRPVGTAQLAKETRMTLACQASKPPVQAVIGFTRPPRSSNVLMPVRAWRRRRGVRRFGEARGFSLLDARSGLTAQVG